MLYHIAKKIGSGIRKESYAQHTSSFLRRLSSLTNRREHRKTMAKRHLWALQGQRPRERAVPVAVQLTKFHGLRRERRKLPLLPRRRAPRLLHPLSRR